MIISELTEKLTKLTGTSVNQSLLAKSLGITRQTVNNRIRTNSELKLNELEKIEKFFNVSILSGTLNTQYPQRDNCVGVKYLPNVYLSAGYGVEVYDEQSDVMMLDESLFVSDRGIKINPKNCEIVKISGNSMFPEYHHGDRVIIDKSDQNLTDGQTYAFRYDGQCYVKEINRAGNKIKCISINKEYEAFLIENQLEFTVFGRIIPRVRL